MTTPLAGFFALCLPPRQFMLDRAFIDLGRYIMSENQYSTASQGKDHTKQFSDHSTKVGAKGQDDLESINDRLQHVEQYLAFLVSCIPGSFGGTDWQIEKRPLDAL
jgi:hypothetical protein